MSMRVFEDKPPSLRLDGARLSISLHFSSGFCPEIEAMREIVESFDADSSDDDFEDVGMTVTFPFRSILAVVMSEHEVPQTGGKLGVSIKPMMEALRHELRIAMDEIDGIRYVD